GACGGSDCDAPMERIELAPQATPERFLALRDRIVWETPLAIVAPRGMPAPLDATIAAVRESPLLPATALVLAAGVLGWSVLARWRGAGAAPGQLAALFAVPVALLALGKPSDDDVAVQLAFLACCI